MKLFLSPISISRKFNKARVAILRAFGLFLNAAAFIGTVFINPHWSWSSQETIIALLRILGKLYEPVAKSQLKKMTKLWQQEVRKAEEKAKREAEAEEATRKRAEEAKKITLEQDASLPAAEKIKITNGEQHRGQRVKVSHNNGFSIMDIRKKHFKLFCRFGLTPCSFYLSRTCATLTSITIHCECAECFCEPGQVKIV